MKVLGNIIWFIFGGLELGLAWWVLGCICYVTIIGIPWGKSCFVMGQFAFFPFGSKAVNRRDLNGGEDFGTGIAGKIGNAIWFVCAGLWLAIGHLFVGVMSSITIIGLPFGLQHFKLAKIAIFPIGKIIVPKSFSVKKKANEYTAPRERKEKSTATTPSEPKTTIFKGDVLQSVVPELSAIKSIVTEKIVPKAVAQAARVEVTAVNYLEKQKTRIGKYMNCPKCNADVADDATFCNGCGYKLSGDGQLLSTNAVITLQDKSAQLFNRVTYCGVSKILFFNTLAALIGGIVSMFSLVEGAYAFALPAVTMVGMTFYVAIKAFVNIDLISKDVLDKILRMMSTFFAYSLFLIAFAGLVAGVSMLVGSWKYAKVIAVYTALMSAYGGVIILCILVMGVIQITSSVRNYHK